MEITILIKTKNLCKTPACQTSRAATLTDDRPKRKKRRDAVPGR